MGRKLNRFKGIILIILASASFGCIPLFAKIAYANGFNPYTFILFRSVFAVIEIFIFLKLKNIIYKVEKEQYYTLFKASFFGYALMMLLLFISYNYLATGLATTLHFIYPVVVMIGSTLIFKEKVDWKKIIALIISITGIYFLIGFGSLNSINFVGIILALVSGLLYPYYVFKVAYGNIKDLNSFVITFYISLFNAITLLFGSIITGNFDLEFNYKGLLSTVLVALICNMMGMVAFQAGLKIISPTTATILSTFEPITSLIIGVIVLREPLFWHHGVGSILIMISVIVVAFAEKKNLIGADDTNNIINS